MGQLTNLDPVEMSGFNKMFGVCDWWKPNGKSNFYGIMGSVKKSRPKHQKDPDKVFSLRKTLAKKFGDKIRYVRILPTPEILRRKGIVATISYKKKQVVVGVAGKIEKGFWADIEVCYEDLKIPRLSHQIYECFCRKLGKRRKRYYANRPIYLRKN